MFVKNIKGRLFASFFLLIFNASPVWASYSSALIDALSQDKQWAMLLHTSDSGSYIHDPKFFLSHPFNKKQELIATIEAFKETKTLGDSHPICKFPARYMWLKEKLGWKDEDSPKPNCTSYQNFLAHVPVKKVQLVFASENISSPISMMGHVFLKLEGTTDSGFHAEHAVTYFTVLDSLNIPRIVYQNFSADLAGMFALQPYQKIKRNYLQKERRNIWEYHLTLTKAQKSLLQAHVWELKSMDSDYLFADHNCATITYFLLGLIQPEILDTHFSWVTPIDVVRLVKKYHLFSGINVETSNQWKIQMLLDNMQQTSLSPDGLRDIQLSNAKDFVNTLTPHERLLALAYLEYLDVNQPALYAEDKQNYLQLQQQLKNLTQGYVLNYSQYKDPSKAPGNRQIQVSLGQYKKDNFLDISLLPAANRLTDDQRQFFSAHELRIADLRVRFYQYKSPEIRSFDIINMRSLNAWNTWTRNLSGQWHMGLEKHIDDTLISHLVFNIAGGLGYTVQLGSDTLVSALYNVGAAGDLNTGYIYHYPEMIVQMNEIWDMKTTVYAKRYFNMYQAGVFNDLKVCQSHYPERNRTWLACAEQQSNVNLNAKTMSFAFQQHF